MKIFKRSIYITFLASLLFSCSEESLNLNSPNDVTVDILTQTEGGLEQLLIGAYDAYQKIPANEYILTELRTDNSRANTENGVLPAYNEYTADSSFLEIYYYWANNYKVISQANLVITNRANLSDSGQTILGEAYFLRALCHFNLVRTFRDIAYIDTVVDVESYRNFPQIPEEDTYARIVEDFTLAIQLLEGVNDWKIRGTEAAASALLAKVYLSQPTPNYSGAQTLLEPFVSGAYNYELLEDFEDIFAHGDSALELNSEIIFAIPYESGSDDAVSSEISADDQIESNAERFSFDMTAAGQSNGVNLITRDLLLDLNPLENAERYYASVDTTSFVDLQLDINGLDSNDYFGYLQSESIVVDPDTGAETVTLTSINSLDDLAGLTDTYDIFQNKYIPDNGNQSGNDWIVLRYADVLLMYSEAILAGAEQTADTSALETFNLVRSRAGLDEITGLLTNEMLLRERRVEFVYENHRLFDLIRFGFATEVLQAFSDSLEYNFQLTDIYLPFPTPENDSSDGFLN